jgi:ribose transport system ATP-binding protein
MSERENILLEVRQCSKSFPGVKAFNKVDFDLYKGEVHCVVGENGAGKTTFIKMLSGALHPDEGTIIIGGKEYSHLNPALAHELGIQTIYQELSLAQDLTVAENIFVGNWPTNRLGLVSFEELYKQARMLLDSLKIDLDVQALVRTLNVPQKQSVQIAKAMAIEAKIFILDEPTAAYSTNEINNLLGLVKKCAENGVGVIYISHHLEEVFDIHDRITVLRDGNKVATHGKKEVSSEEIIREMVGRDVSKFYTREKVDIDWAEAVEFQDFSDGGSVLGVSFKVHKGEILGFAGMVGSGRTELTRLIFGADSRISGTTIVEGRKVGINSPREAINEGFACLTEDRQKTGMILQHSVEWNTMLAHLNNSRGIFINEKLESKNVRQYVKSLDIKTPSIKQIVKNLSGGNQQKVVLAKWLYANAKIIIFDEPTRGIDIGSKEEIYKAMVELAKQGKYILMISSDMPELIAMCDRIVVMKKGKIAKVLDKEEISEENILTYSIGGTL